MAKKQTPRGRRRVKKKTAKSPLQASQERRLKEINQEIQTMVSSGAAKVRPGKLKELQEEAAPLAARLRARRRTT